MTSAYDNGDCPEVQTYHRLRIARMHAGLDPQQLAEKIGVSRNTISNAELGRVNTRRVVINAWALACGVSAHWIMTGLPPEGWQDSTSALGIISAERQLHHQLKQRFIPQKNLLKRLTEK